MKHISQMNKNKIDYEKSELEKFQTINPMLSSAKTKELSFTDYTLSIPKPKYDEDIYHVLQTANFLNNLAPKVMPEYNFNLEEINGESFYKPDGSLLLIREWDSDVIRDYYASSDKKSVYQILEHDKKTGRLRIKIEPMNRDKGRLEASITIFDDKVNNKYIIMQLSHGGIVNNISEFTGKGKSFQTLFRNPETFKPVRYLEGKDDSDEGFVMLDCLFNDNNEVVRIKKFTNKKEFDISYTKESKNITVKTKSS